MKNITTPIKKKEPNGSSAGNYKKAEAQFEASMKRHPVGYYERAAIYMKPGILAIYHRILDDKR